MSLLITEGNRTMQKRLAGLFVAFSLVLALSLTFAFGGITAANYNTKHVVSTSAIQLEYAPIGRCGELCDDNGPLSSHP